MKKYERCPALKNLKNLTKKQAAVEVARLDKIMGRRARAFVRARGSDKKKVDAEMKAVSERMWYLRKKFHIIIKTPTYVAKCCKCGLEVVDFDRPRRKSFVDFCSKCDKKSVFTWDKKQHTMIFYPNGSMDLK